MTTPQPVLDDKTTKEISDKLDGMQLPVPKFLNAPEGIESAVQRIMELETALEDLSRAVEIAMVSRQFDLVEGFRSRADELLLNKIVVEQPTNNEFKLTIINNGSNKR
jgi:hypothetical protein